VEQVKGGLAAVVLAAGLSRRMGEDKLLLQTTDGLLCERALTLAERFPVRVLVTNTPQLRALGEARGFAAVENPKAAQGIGTSVAAGTAALPQTVSGCIYFNADQPRLSESLVSLLVEAFAKTDRIIVPRTADGTKNPCIFPRRYFPELCALAGDRGGRAVWKAHLTDVEYVPVADDTLFIDIDEREQYERLVGQKPSDPHIILKE
jgi:molybdenum cofactor cytidylyltransferase